MDFIGKQPGKTTLISNGISSIKGNVLKRPDKVALRTESFSETYAEMWQRCIKLANTLLDRGYKKGDLSVTYMSNCYQIVEMMIACEMIGMPLSYGNFRLTPEEIIYQINDCEAKIVFVLQDQYDLIYPLMDRLPTVKNLVLVGESTSNDPGVLKFEEMIAAGSPVDPQVVVDPEDIQNLFYTSGTTGKPKGAVRDAYCNYNLAVSTAVELGINRDDSLFIAAPMYAAATVGYLYTTLMVGGTVCIAPSFLPEESLRLIDLFKNTFVFMVPIMFDWLFMPPPEVQVKYDLSSVRLAVSCGAPMHTHIFAKMRKVLKMPFA
ncbi:MAG TPA: AMP-binding protein [Syntrophomonas sp.]|nr:AMP-binding protein [Syntrophomonas sp.]